jgi:hypothetical protein
MKCPRCRDELIQGVAKIEGVWMMVWLCGCKPTKEDVERWDKERAHIIKKHWDGIPDEHRSC